MGFEVHEDILVTCLDVTPAPPLHRGGVTLGLRPKAATGHSACPSISWSWRFAVVCAVAAGTVWGGGAAGDPPSSGCEAQADRQLAAEQTPPPPHPPRTAGKNFYLHFFAIVGQRRRKDFLGQSWWVGGGEGLSSIIVTRSAPINMTMTRVFIATEAFCQFSCLAKINAPDHHTF